MKTVVGLFDDLTLAQKAAADLESSGVPHADISFLANNEQERVASVPAAHKQGGEMAHAAVVDAEIGAGIGGVLGLLAGASLFVIPGLGWLAGAGWLAGMLGGAAVGGVAGGLIGALTHIGVPERDAAYYTEGVRRGGTLLAIRADDARAHTVAQILDRNGAVDIEERGTQYAQEGFVPPAAARVTPEARPAATPVQSAPPAVQRDTRAGRDLTIPVVEEELQVGKRAEQRGGARIHTYIQEHPVQQQVDLRDEHVTVERRPANRPASPDEVSRMREDTFVVTETAEVPVVQKTARVVEDVVVGKETSRHTETVADTVRRTDVQVDRMPGSEHTGRAAATFDSYANDFRGHWRSNSSSAGGRYEDYEPSYRYGYDLANNAQYRGKNWNAIEMDVQNDWNRRYPNTWDRMKNSIRYGYDRAVSGGIPGEGSIPGIQTGGRAVDGTPDTRGITEKVADAVTGDRTDDKTGRRV